MGSSPTSGAIPVMMAVRIHLFPYRASAKRDALPRVPVNGKRQNTEVKLTCARSTCLLRLGDKFAGFQKNKRYHLGASYFFIENGA